MNFIVIKVAVVVSLLVVLNIVVCNAAKKGKMAPKPEKLREAPANETMTSSSEELDELAEAAGMNDTSKEEIEEEPGLSLEEVIEEEEVEDETAEEEEDEMEDESSKKSVKNFTCQVTGALLAMAESIKELTEDINSIKTQMFEKCPGFEYNSTTIEGTVGDDMLNDTDSETEVEEDDPDDVTDEVPSTTLLPPIPTECDPPFQPVASSCYYFLYYPSDWKTWGDANAYCQNLGGTLAAPYRLSDLREYLVENFSNVFWVGAKKTGKGPFQWLNGEEVNQDDWKESQPSRTTARKNCVYLEYFSGYKAINHYCGEKFSFVCEARVDVEDEE